MVPNAQQKDVELLRDRFLSIASDYGQLTFGKLCRNRLAHGQLAIYRFLDKPKGLLAQLYHFAVFAFIVLIYILGAVAEYNSESNNPSESSLASVHFLEILLALYLLAEFLIRLWAIGADAHFRGFRGRFVYLCRPICLIDLVVLITSFLVLPMPGNPIDGSNSQSGTTAFLRLGHFAIANPVFDKLRFLQFLRLLDVDRQMSAFTLVRRMVRRSSFELLSAYYITFMIFLTLAVCVFTAEEWLEETESKQSGDPAKTFATFGDSFWFSIVTVLTIGYGDIVPRSWLSKLAICLLSYLGLSMFSAASGLVGVGMSLMVNGEKQQRQQSKVRDLAARLIQSWVRFHLISDREIFGRIRVYRKCCAKLQRAEERIGKGREMARIAAERKAERKQQQGQGGGGGGRLVRVLQKYSPIMEKRQSPLLRPRAAQIQQEIDQLEDFSDEERILDYYYGQRSHSNSLLSNKSEETGNVPDCVNGRHRSILRMCYFFAFISLRKKFKRMRSPYELMDAEAELYELEHQRMQKFKELEMRLDTQLGTKWTKSALGRNGKKGRKGEEEEEEEGGRWGIGQRMEMCERKMAEMERKVEFIEHLTGLILKGFHHHRAEQANIPASHHHHHSMPSPLN